MFPAGNIPRSNDLGLQSFRPETIGFRAETAQDDLQAGDHMADQALNLDERLRQRIGRPSRIESVAIRFTEGELASLETAADEKGTTLREWARETLLREARRSKDDALFTEVIATRMLLNNLLGPMAAGQTVTQEKFVEIIATVRDGKRNAAREVMRQYTEADQKEQ